MNLKTKMRKKKPKTTLYTVNLLYIFISLSNSGGNSIKLEQIGNFTLCQQTAFVLKWKLNKSYFKECTSIHCLQSYKQAPFYRLLLPIQEEMKKLFNMHVS